MAQMDVLARIRKTGEERIYPNTVFENICDDVDNPLDFVRYVDIPQDNPPQIQQAQPQATHQQILIDELLKTRNEKLALEQELEELKLQEPKKSVGRPKKEEA